MHLCYSVGGGVYLMVCTEIHLDFTCSQSSYLGCVPLHNFKELHFLGFFPTTLSTFSVCQYDSHDMGCVELSFIAVCVSNSFPSCFSLFWVLWWVAILVASTDLFLVHHYTLYFLYFWLRSIKGGQFKLVYFASHVIRVQIFQTDFPVRKTGR